MDDDEKYRVEYGGGNDELERIVNEGNMYKDIIAESLREVHLFIAKRNLLLYGGMAIDLALRAKGSHMYGPDVLPDYDFMTPNFHKDSYDFGTHLHKKGLPNVECINAMHPSTMKVRTNFIGVADISYVPKTVYDQLPFITYNGLRIIHPHYQMLDQHVALCMPFRSAPWEVINHRWKKDMTRYDLLHKYYPVEIKEEKVTKWREFSVPTQDLVDQCVGGFAGIMLLNNIAAQMGYKAPKKFSYLGNATVVGGKLNGKMPVDSHGMTLYSDDLWWFDKGKPKALERRWYNSFMEKIPRKLIIGNEFEVIDNQGTQISAHLDEASGLWLANPQVLCLYFLSNYILFRHMKDDDRGYAFYMGYKACQSLVKWASENYDSATPAKLRAFLPSPVTFGKYGVSQLYIHNVEKMAMHLGDIPRIHGQQPKAIYFRDLPGGVIPPMRYEFDPTQSKYLNFDGLPTTPFNPVAIITKGL